MKRRRVVAAILVLGLGAVIVGCSSLSYYGQAIRGGLEIVCKKRPITRLLAEPGLAPELRQRLEVTRRIRNFAVSALALPDNASYRSYADLGRPYASWTVTAAPELSLTPVEWCFPIAGCVTYRGYFSPEGAERFAAGLKARGYDVDVGGVAAFSTLGWFADPLLNTFIDQPDPDLAGLIFHELAHQVAYAGDDTVWNESFATAVERVGVARWLEAEGRAEEIAAWRRDLEREEAVLALLAAARERLAKVYAAPEGDEWKRGEKARVLGELSERHGLGFNNARLASFAAYHELVSAFEALLAREAGNLPAFYARVRELSKRPAAERRALLNENGPGS
ncbi:MAG TPA: aminopeptidase [Thermoanaerobaculia bacterium]|nr:aminopeptidase [Thermoanaerobaculia bacterium]